MADDFNFADAYKTEEPWEVYDQLLPSGDYVITFVEAENTETKGGMGREVRPQVELKVQNAQGSRKDWLVITPKTIRKVVAPFIAAGVGRPGPGDVDPSTGKLSDEYVAKIIGKKAGVVIRDEPSLKDPMKMEPRIQGYRAVDQMEADAPIDTSGLPGSAQAASSSRPAEEAASTIPF